MARTRSTVVHGRGVSHPQRRARLLLIFVFMVFSLFAAQLFRLQGLDAASVSEAAVNDRLTNVTIPAARGSIVDASGEILADDTERARVEVNPLNVPLYERWEGTGAERTLAAEGINGAAADIAEITGADPSDIAQKITQTEGMYGILLPSISPEQWQEINDLGIPGITSTTIFQRDYPLGAAPAPLLGWISDPDYPAGGLELTRDEVLQGVAGEKLYERGGAGEVITTGDITVTEAIPGDTVHLSIDSDLQWYAYNAVEQRVKESAALSGYALVQEVDTGRIVAAASYPSFDPTDETQSADGMRNALVEDVFEPGSTGKLITAAAALEEGIVTSDTPIVVPVGMSRAGQNFKDAHDHPEQDLTFAGVLATSSNMGTILYGEKLDDDVFYDYLLKFGLGTTSGLGLPGESTGVVPAPESWSATSKFTMMFGQGLSSNALQQMSVYQTMANDGVRIQPTLVSGVTDHDGVYQAEPQPEGERIVSSETATTLTQIMEQVPTPSGTAPQAAIDGYHVAGKTSTADRYDPELGKYDRTTASFIGYAPADDPKYVVAVTVQRPTQISQYGGTIAGPVFADIMRYALQESGIAPTDEPQTEVAVEFDPDAAAPGEGPGVTLGDIAIRDE